MRVYIFGLGAIGSNLTIQMMKQFPDFTYYGIDYDKIEERNIRTQAYFLEQVGMPKAHAIPVLACRFNRKIYYKPFNVKLEISAAEFLQPYLEKPFIDKNTLVIDCFDNSASRKLLCGAPDENVLHIGFSPFYTAEIMWQKDYDVPGDVDPSHNDICSMDAAVGFIHYIVNFSLLTISDYIKNDKKNSYIITNKTNIKRIS